VLSSLTDEMFLEMGIIMLVTPVDCGSGIGIRLVVVRLWIRRVVMEGMERFRRLIHCIVVKTKTCKFSAFLLR
jgi:hypothetical protein